MKKSNLTFGLVALFVVFVVLFPRCNSDVATDTSEPEQTSVKTETDSVDVFIPDSEHCVPEAE